MDELRTIGKIESNKIKMIMQINYSTCFAKTHK